VRPKWARLGPRARRLLAVAAGVLAAPWLALVVAAALTPLPAELGAAPAYDASVRFVDREGALVKELRAGDGARARWVRLDDMGERVVVAIVAAEDRRFFRHAGVDPLAMLRAALDDAAARRVVSGASTLTQQLARIVVPHRRTLAGKLGEMALALRIEASLSKRAVLEQYLNRAPFGPGLRGVEAASRFYFDKPARDLSLAEAAALAGLPRGPTLYDPRKGTERLRRRRDRVLARIAAGGGAPAAEVARALAEPLVLAPRGGGLGAPHLVQALLAGRVDEAAGALRGRAALVETTLERGLQREVEVLAQSTVRALAARHVTAAAVVVLENATGDVLAYVGSPDAEDAARLGQNDGVLAERQPGSSLKPFVYELAMERRGFTAATVLPDVDTSFASEDGAYRPQNYDGRYHGPVRLREALANSYNVPAVWTASVLGPDAVVARLREVGLGLGEAASRYGVAVALGDGEVRLLDLANAYATLARGGVWRPVRAVRSARGPAGEPLPRAPAEPRRILDEASAFVITDVLADKNARVASFGEGSVLELPFPVAVKTGTSKGFRDNVAVGFTPDVTVAVWVGNFDGSPMSGVSGVAGAGPLFHDAMLAASRARAPRPFERPDGIVEAEVCALSGMMPTAACPHTRRELFVAGPGRAPPAERCAMHERVAIDRRTGLRAGPGCPEDAVEERTFEAFPPAFAAWAAAAGRPVAPEASSPLCPAPAASSPARAGRLRVAYPPDGARFTLDPSLASRQAIPLRAEAPAGAAHVRLVVDGRAFEVRPPAYVLDWPLAAGAHRVRAEADGMAASEEIEVAVE
jgi:penicillin-binding protein 1C